MRLFALCNKYFQQRAFFSRNYPKNQDVSLPPRPFLRELWRFPGHSSSAEAVSPCFAPKTRMFPYRPTIFSMFCGAFRDIFFCGGIFSMFCAQNQDVSLPPHNFLPDLWRFPGHFPPWRQFLHVLPQKPGCFPTAPQFSPCFVALSRIFFFLGSIFSRKCGVFRDIFSPRWNRQNFCGEEY